MLPTPHSTLNKTIKLVRNKKSSSWSLSANSTSLPSLRSQSVMKKKLFLAAFAVHPSTRHSHQLYVLNQKRMHELWVDINVAIVIKSFPRSLLEGAPKFLTVQQTGRSNRQFSFFFFCFSSLFWGLLVRHASEKVGFVLFRLFSMKFNLCRSKEAKSNVHTLSAVKPMFDS